MSLAYNSLACCAIKEIDGLDEGYTAEQVMADFCKNNLDKFNPWRGLESAAKSKTLCTFYLFTAEINAKDHVLPYGTRLSKFIRDNDLGEVISTKSMISRVYHPDHSVRAWIWSPNVAALTSWWKTNKGKIPEYRGY